MKSITDKINEELKKIQDLPVPPDEHEDSKDTILLSDDKDMLSWDNMNSTFKLDDMIIQPLDWGNLSSLTNHISIGNNSGTSTLNTQYQSSLYNTANPSYSWNTLTPNNNVNIHGNGIDLNADADIMIGGRSMKKLLEGIEQRLSILVPDPKKLERYEALKQAYEHYKTLEALCNEEPNQEKK